MTQTTYSTEQLQTIKGNLNDAVSLLKSTIMFNQETLAVVFFDETYYFVLKELFSVEQAINDLVTNNDKLAIEARLVALKQHIYSIDSLEELEFIIDSEHEAPTLPGTPSNPPNLEEPVEPTFDDIIDFENEAGK